MIAEKVAGGPSRLDDVDACGHAFLLIPCDSDASCESKANVATTMTIQQPAAIIVKTRSTDSRRTPSQILSAWRTQLAQHHAAPQNVKNNCIKF